MFAIDGLVSGLDTTSIIEGLLSIQQSQIDRLNLRKQEIVTKQSAFKGIEANAVTLKSAVAQLASFTNDVFSVFSASSSDDSIIEAAADRHASEGVFQVRVTQLARAEQAASQGFSSAESLITQGTFGIRVGNKADVNVEITDQNNTVQGFVDAINSASDDVSASLVNDGSSFRILLTSEHTGAENTITITNGLADTAGSETKPDFSGDLVQAAADSIINLGSGPGAITVYNSTNMVEDVIEGVTLNLLNVDTDKDVTISVGRDVEPAKTAIEGFVESFNNLMTYVDEQTRYDQEGEQAGLLLGFSSASSIREQIRGALARIVPNLATDANRLSSIGITFNDAGKLQIDSGRLDQALNGGLEGVTIDDVRRLFALDGQTNDSNVEFVLGTKDTLTSDGAYEVVVTQAAERAKIAATSPLAGSIVIGDTNNTLSISVDGLDSGSLSLTNGTYTQTELADHVQSVINQSETLSGRDVQVTVDNGSMVIESITFGTRSEVGSVAGSAAADLGFAGSEYGRGKDVAGYFAVDGETETATGNGRLLIGDAENANTSGLQLRVTLVDSQISGTHHSEVTVTRGFAAQLDAIIENLLDEENGRFKTSSDGFDDQIESIDSSITRLNDLFEIKQQQLIRDFLAIETNISNLRNTSSFLSSQLGTASSLTGT